MTAPSPESYVFGYGSLVNTATHSYAPVFPATLAGWRRLWGMRFPARGLTSLTVTPDRGSSTVGVIARVSPAQWAALNAREAGYERHVVPASAIRHDGPPEAQVYVFAAPDPAPATRDYPILASYLDVVLTGFAQLGGRAAQQAFVASTDGWGDTLADDRAAPLYPRAQTLAAEEASAIDSLLPPLTRVRPPQA